MSGANADILRYSQFGVENTAGTAADANRALRSISILAKPVSPTVMLRQRGSVINERQVAVLGAMTTGAYEGFLAFNDIALMLANMLKAATISTPSGATNARDWTTTVSKNGALTPKTWTVEDGISGVDASRFAYAVLNSLKIDFTGTQEPRVSGDVIGQLMAEEGVTLTATPTEIACVPASMAALDWFIADSIAGLSSGQQTDVYGKSFELSGLRDPVFPQNSTNSSFAGLVRKEVRCYIGLTMEKGSQSDLLMRQNRGQRTQYVQFKFTGPQIETGFNYELEVTMAFKVSNPDRATDSQLRVANYDLEAVDDSSLGGFIKFRVRTSLTALPSGSNLASGQQPPKLISDLTSVGSL